MGSVGFHITNVPVAVLEPHGEFRILARLADEGPEALGFSLLTEKRAGHVSHSNLFDRAAAAEQIGRQNPTLPTPPADASYVVAGQQAGLLTGPLYTILKAISAIAMARRMSAARGRPVLPLFWIASEDHDVLEVNRVTVNGRKFVHDYPGELARGQVPQVGDIDLTEARDRLLAFLEDSLPETEFRPEILERISKLDFRTYGTAFRDLMSQLFAAWELRLIDPIPLRPLTGPVLAALVERWEEVTAAFSAGTQAVREKGLTPPLEKPGFFELHEGKRVPVSIEDGRVRLAAETISIRGAAECIRRQPQRFSPGAALRPICQDAILPVLATLAGPSELTYLWQIEPIYPVIGAAPSLRHPRISATFLEPPILRAAERARLPMAEIFRAAELLAAPGSAAKVSGVSLSVAAGEALPDAPADGPPKQTPDRQAASPQLEHAARIDEQARTLLAAIDRIPTDQPPRWLRKSRTAIESAAARIVAELHRDQQEAAGLTRERLEKIAAAILPEGKPQERVANVIQFLNLHGDDFLRESVESLDPLSLEHQVVAIAGRPQEKKR
ncbi:MAG: bacillithiol biosynthesis BshC [Candidatus Eisenbacteria sp.]|nr:bacillithiol biosynthesis BshC [Candidatus Eisenbacteria bacterium]